MTESITINGHSYSITERGQTMTSRKADLGAAGRATATTSHNTQKSRGVMSLRSLRRIAVPVTLSDGATGYASVSLVFDHPVNADTASLGLAFAELMSWAGQANFLAEVNSQQI